MALSVPARSSAAADSAAAAGLSRLLALSGLSATAVSTVAQLQSTTAAVSAMAQLQPTAAAVPAVAQLPATAAPAAAATTTQAACHVLVQHPLRRHADQHCMEIWRNYLAVAAVEQHPKSKHDLCRHGHSSLRISLNQTFGAKHPEGFFRAWNGRV